jgi:hypothetical protein
VATFTVKSATADTVNYTAVDTTDPVTLASTVVVSFVSPEVSAANSSVSVSPASVPADGTTHSTISVTLRDQASNPAPVAAKTVSLSQGTGHSTIIPTTAVTGSNGVATFSVTDSTTESVTYSATDATDATHLQATGAVTFGTLAVSSTLSTVTAPTPAQVGATATTVTVTLLAANGVTPVSGKTVTLEASSTTAVITPAGSQGVSDAAGQVVFGLTDSVAESVTITATDSTDGGLQLTQRPTIVFQAAVPSASVSTLTTGTSTEPADGQTSAELSVTITDQFGNPLSGKMITLSASPSGTVAITPLAVNNAGTPGTTNGQGIAQFDVNDDVAEAVIFTATDTTDSLMVTQTAKVTFTAGPAVPWQSAIGASPMMVAADGMTASTITVTLGDNFQNPVVGKQVKLTSIGGSAVISPVSNLVTTNALGLATFQVTDTANEVVTFSATDVTDSLPLTGQAVAVTFGTPPAPPASIADSTITVSAASVPADGTTAKVSVLLIDTNGTPILGKVVALNPSSGSSIVTTVNGTTDSTGAATFTVSDKTAETVTYSATDVTDKEAITGSNSTIAFTAATTSSSSTTISTTTTTAPAGSGSTSATGSTTGSAGTTTASGGSGTGSSATLAVTGAPSRLPWIVGLGLVLLVLGTLGRKVALLRSRRALSAGDSR